VEALERVKRAVDELGAVDRLLELEDVPEPDRAPIAGAMLAMRAEESWLRGQLQRTRLRGPSVPPGDAPALAPGAPPPPAVALLRLFGTRSEATVETDGGERLRLRLDRLSGERAVAAAAGPLLAPGDRVVGAASGVDGVCWRVDLRCEAATRLEPGHAVVRLRAMRVTPGGEEPLLAGGEARLQVIDCENIAPLSHVHGELLGLSAVGFEFATTAPLRPGDRLRFHRRYFAEMVDGDVRVDSVQPVGAPGALRVACWFVDIDSGSQAALERVLRRATVPRSPVDYQGLLSLAGTEPEPPRRGLRRLFVRRRPG
jgi:hypothetical protein